MKNFDSILTDCLTSKGLKYIRFKVDPTINAGFESSKSYEGFVLQELSAEERRTQTRIRVDESYIFQKVMENLLTAINQPSAKISK